MKPKISVVIPTYKRPFLLKRCIQALAKQSIGKHTFEVIVVSDGHDKKTGEMLTTLQKTEKLRICFYNLPIHKGPAAARNFGASKTSSDFLAFTDDDCIPDIHWLKEGLQVLESGHHVISGNVIVPLPKNPTDADVSLSHLEAASFVTANCFCTKAVFQRVGGFTEDFTMAWREDSDFEFKIRDIGIPIEKTEKAIVVHPPKKTYWGISLFEQKKSSFNALLYKRHKELYTKYIQPLPPLHYYGIVLSFLTLIIAIISQNHAVIFFSTYIWTFLTIRFMIKRIKPSRKSFSHLSDMIISSLFIPFLAVFWRLKGAISYKVFFL